MGLRNRLQATLRYLHLLKSNDLGAGGSAHRRARAHEVVCFSLAVSRWVSNTNVTNVAAAPTASLA